VAGVVVVVPVVVVAVGVAAAAAAAVVVWIDSQMHFAEHAKKERGKCFGKLRVLKFITSCAWGIGEKSQ
jgi:hypothetical protein